MALSLYQIDAFTNKAFGGNPAAVCPLEEWLEDDILQNIAAENNLSETAFFVAEKNGYRLRWFTPLAEVRLCGHATLASAFVIFNFINPSLRSIAFESLSGTLNVKKADNGYTLDFPRWSLQSTDTPVFIEEGLGAQPQEFYLSDDAVAVFDSAETVSPLKPNMNKLSEYRETRGIIVTAPGYGDIDFVSRCFYPRLGVPEDPVTGSAHCALAPYWSKRLGKDRLRAQQLSARGGELTCALTNGERVELTGEARLYLEGKIYI